MKFLKCLIVVLSLMSVSAFAKTSGHIVSGSTSSEFNLNESSNSNGYDVDFSLGLGYDYAFVGGFQVGGILGTSIFSGGSVWSLAVGPSYNFNDDIESSYYAGARIGYITYHFDRNTSSDDTFLLAEFGKRFKLMENVSYMPSISVTKFLGDNTPDPAFSISLFKLAIIF